MYVSGHLNVQHCQKQGVIASSNVEQGMLLVKHWLSSESRVLEACAPSPSPPEYNVEQGMLLVKHWLSSESPAAQPSARFHALPVVSTSSLEPQH